MYASDMHMAFNHTSDKTIRSTMEKKLRQTGSAPSTIQLTFSGFRTGNLKLQPNKLLNHSYHTGEVLCTDVCGPMRTEGNMLRNT